MDADGQHDPEYIKTFLSVLDEGNDMVVGARCYSSQAGLRRSLANRFYNWLASLIVGYGVSLLVEAIRTPKATD